DLLALDQIELEANGRRGLGGCAGEFGVALAGVHIAKVKERAGVEDREHDAVAGGRVTNVEVAAPGALAVEARRHLAIRGHAERADERRDRPGEPIVEMQRAVARRTAGAGRVAEDARRVVAGELGPTRRFAERAAARADGDP